jgi:hypothetical protein
MISLRRRKKLDLPKNSPNNAQDHSLMPCPAMEACMGGRWEFKIKI